MCQTRRTASSPPSAFLVCHYKSGGTRPPTKSFNLHTLQISKRHKGPCATSELLCWTCHSAINHLIVCVDLGLRAWTIRITQHSRAFTETPSTTETPSQQRHNERQQCHNSTPTHTHTHRKRNHVQLPNLSALFCFPQQCHLTTIHLPLTRGILSASIQEPRAESPNKRITRGIGNTSST